MAGVCVCEVLGLAERCVAALAVIIRSDVGRRDDEAAVPARGTKQVEGWKKDVTSARTRHGQDKLCRRWCDGGGIVQT